MPKTRTAFRSVRERESARERERVSVCERSARVREKQNEKVCLREYESEGKCKATEVSSKANRTLLQSGFQKLDSSL